MSQNTNRPASFEDACQLTGYNPNDAFNSSSPDEVAYRKLKVIAEALNEGWKPDWDDEDEYKYYPWFNMGSSGAGFSFYVCVYGYGHSAVGSRLCFKSAELAEYAGKQFIAIYKDYYTI